MIHKDMSLEQKESFHELATGSITALVQDSVRKKATVQDCSANTTYWRWSVCIKRDH